MAHELDEEPLMSLEDKYAWSLAPVNLDNNMLKVRDVVYATLLVDCGYVTATPNFSLFIQES